MIDNVPQFINEKARVLKKAGIDQAIVEIELILCHLLVVDRMKLYLDGVKLLNEKHLDKFDEILNKRLTRYPLQYILGEAWFYGRKFHITPAVMAPTPETELLCETALGFVKERNIDKPKILDVGTGSGVVVLTLACELKQSRVVALDVSDEALEVAKTNAGQFGVEDRVKFVCSDFFSTLSPDDKFDLILSNPPYIADGDYEGLPPEVKADPKIAMVAGSDGLDAIRVIIKEAPAYLAGNGRLMFEIGCNQVEKIVRLTEKDELYKNIVILKDLNDIDRVVVLGCDDE